MERRYSDLTVEELRQEVASLTEKARKAEQMGMVNEYAVYERKILMAKSYMLNPQSFRPGEVYEIQGDPGLFFKVRYMNGIFAWGDRQDAAGTVQENLTGDPDGEALPISILGSKVS
ncbi:hypothetical protein N781_02375 [Pontibacillus halophilus JSM 076056 = DSM 19796]|uniref:Uncharacterized protein n=1 Tax=Pontibacillus halophilus JSM 076056 = DSM 19796 TaxID=1385510 RepID=A0A0A5IDZ3_9BACI|nr:YfhH family protein [Pontibacillus halophilus]KGX94032.1 hypothetical protein N781_02375 [Pontibacillus halophilus JSM 076056 = DSM 19796]